jgi:2-keto-4-pentenoate hydratase/2-oxohepta-3-ene-1,7-dioic acid hydratase in catechol pathway
MTISVLRTDDSWWNQTGLGAAKIATRAATTGELLTDRTAIETAAHSADTVPVDSLCLISPVTAPCRVVAQMTNFASHVKAAGMNPKIVPLTFFRKASGSISGPFDDIVKPQYVKLLDYEVEIGLVIGRDIPVGTEITEVNLAGFIAGLVVTNDVSARDVQLTKTQFYEAKSYPTFTPVGPALVLLDADELKRFGDLRLELRVNGEVRQDMLVDGDMIYKPLQAAITCAIPAFGCRRSGSDRHSGRDGPERSTQTGRDNCLNAAADDQVEGILPAPGEQPEVPPPRRRGGTFSGDRRRRHRSRRSAHRCEECVTQP